jgi:hypothetical protein
MILIFEGMWNFDVNFGRATLDTWNAPWILGAKSAFAGTEENDGKSSRHGAEASRCILICSQQCSFEFSIESGKKKQ